MKKTLLSLALAGSLFTSSCASRNGPFVSDSFREQPSIGILGHQTITYLKGNSDEFIDMVTIRDRKLLYHEGSKQGYSKPISLMEFEEKENPIGVTYSGKILSIYTTKGVHTFRNIN